MNFFHIFSSRINCRIPGQGTLIIQVWDEDIIKDELIGETAIDIEERFFDEGYRHMKEQPIERRKLYLPGTQQEVGFLNCWVDIFRNVSKRDVFFQKNRLRKQPRLWDISSIPAQEYELRVVIWEVKDVPLVDIVGTTDIFVKGIVSCGEKNLEDKTDVHKNSSNGYVSTKNKPQKLKNFINLFLKRAFLGENQTLETSNF